MSPGESAQDVIRWYWRSAALFALALIPLFATSVLPLIDFYNHLARFYVLSHLDGTSPLRNAYLAHWSLLPDIGTDVIATPVLALVEPLLAAKLIVAAILAVLFGGLLYFHRALTGQRSLLVAVMLLPLLYSYVLNWGFANFLLGLGMAFWAAGWWIKHRLRPRLAVPVACLWALLIFFAHGVAFALYGLLLGALEIGFFFVRKDRSLAGLARMLLLVAVQAIIPVAVFLAWQTGEAADAAATLPALLSQGVPPLAHNGLHRLGAILRVEEGPAYWFDSLTFTAQAAILCFLFWRGRVAIVRPAWPLIGLALLLVAAIPSQLFGVFYISDRMPLFAALCLFGALMVARDGWTPATRIAAGLIIVIALTRILAIAADWRAYDQDYREFRSIAGRVPPATPVLEIMVGSGHHETGLLRCEMYGPLLVPLDGGFVPLFADSHQQPLLLTGALGQAQDRLKRLMTLPDERTTDYNPYMQAAAAAGFDYLLACNADLLTRPFPANFAVVARTPHFAVLHVVQ